MADEKKTTDGSLALDQKKVIVINAAERPETQKLRVAAYARVSSDSADQLNSFAAQLNYYNTLIASNDAWSMVDLYADKGITGTSAEKRPDFQRLLADCRKGRVDKILVKSISRFARNAKECLEIVRELKAIGIGVCFEEQDIDTSKMTGELLTAVFAAIAQKESESISENMRWSYKHRMESGTFLPPSTAYGYKIENGKIVIDEEKAEVVRRIFKEYLQGTGATRIAEKLNSEGIPAKSGQGEVKWHSNAVFYILSNERYIGDSLWQKTYCTETLPSRHVRNYGEREQYYAENTHPAIIEKNIFDAAQNLNRERHKTFFHEKSSVQGPLNHKMHCGGCGATFMQTGRGRTHWACYRHYQDDRQCTMPRIPEAEIHSAFLRLYHKLKDPETPILAQLCDELQAIHYKRMLWSADVVELNKRISDIADQNQLLTSMNQLGLVDPDIFITRSNEYATQLRAAKQEKERLIDAERDALLHKTRDLIDVLETMPEFLPEFDGEIFSELIDQVVVESGSELRFQLVNGLQVVERIERMIR